MCSSSSLGFQASCVGTQMLNPDGIPDYTMPMDLNTPTADFFMNDTDLTAPSPDTERMLLVDPSNVIPSLGKKPTRHSLKTPDQKQREKERRRVKIQENKNGIKRKAEQQSRTQEESERRCKVAKEAVKELELSVTDLKGQLEDQKRSPIPQPRKNAAYYQEQLACHKALAKETEAARAKNEAAREEEDAVVEKRKAAELVDLQQNVLDLKKKIIVEQRLRTTLANNYCKQQNSFTDDVSKKVDEEVVLVKKTVRAEATDKASHFAAEIAAMKIDRRATKSRYRALQEEVVAKNELHRTKVADAAQGSSDFYEQEVSNLTEALDVPDLESKVIVDGVVAREWDLSYWLGQMQSMMHATPAVVLKLWGYAMNYVESTSTVKRSKD